VIHPQIDDSGHRILQEIAGRWKQYSGRIPADFLCFPVGKHWKKFPELPGTGCFRAGLFDLDHDETL
jgi:hypothetical protein